ncbi:hypothetical protein ACH4S8_38030 [Streptomyces sp. NPDC021080]|uniref:hypothetical protein n=1 Tax=Streptomyces sp. NPDC021080 TaxID=3365110 RepID=UPI00379A0667
MNVPKTVRTYAKDAHKRYATELQQMRERINERPGDFTADRFVEYQAARTLHFLYAEPLSLDDNGETSFDDEKLMDRINDARATAWRALRTRQHSMSGVEIVMQDIRREAVKKFLSDLEFIDLEAELQEAEPLTGRALLDTLRAADHYQIVRSDADPAALGRERSMSASSVVHLFSVALEHTEGATVTGTADRIECGELVALREGSEATL